MFRAAARSRAALDVCGNGAIEGLDVDDVEAKTDEDIVGDRWGCLLEGKDVVGGRAVVRFVNDEGVFSASLCSSKRALGFAPRRGGLGRITAPLPVLRGPSSTGRERGPSNVKVVGENGVIVFGVPVLNKRALNECNADMS